MSGLVLLLFVLSLVILLLGATYLLGFRLGSRRWLEELARVRLEGAQATREIWDVTRDAFVAITEHVEQQSKDRAP
jgi:hypothetical protein